jgi:protein TonB
LESLLNWHFTKDAAGTTRQIVVTFHLPDPSSLNAAREMAVPTAVMSGTLGGTLSPMASTAPVISRPTPSVHFAPTPPSSSDSLTIQAIEIKGVLIPNDELLSKLPPLHVNDKVPRQDLAKFLEAVPQVDEHLSASLSSGAPNSVTVRISAPYSERPVAMTAPPAVPGVIPVGGRVQNNKLVSQTPPVYPEIAKSARIQGIVELAALIGQDGHVQQLSVVSGHPLLRQAALDAVKEWVYAPTLLNEQPVSVSTTVDIIFSLSQ